MRRVVLLVLLCWCTHSQAAPSTMYRCEVHGVTTYSDRPCGSDATLHEPTDSVSTYAPPAQAERPRTERHATARATRKPAPNDDASSKRAELCERLTRSLKEVRSKMRAGYKAKEGERLRERMAKLKAQSESARCK